MTDTESEGISSGVIINVFPNPFIESTTFEVKGLQKVGELELQVYDLQGRLIQQNRFTSNRFEYYRGQLPRGMYIYRMLSGGQLISTGKIVVR